MTLTCPWHELQSTETMLYRIHTIGLLALGLAMTVPHPAMAQADPGRVRMLVDAHAHDAIALYRDLLGLPNDSRHPEDILRLVEWLEQALGERGFQTRRLDTGTNPLLLAERSVPGAGRTALIYLQADGQPVDAARWDQPDPYTAVLKEQRPDGSWEIVGWDRLGEAVEPSLRVFARSAADSKGPVAQFLSALDVMERAGLEPSVNLKVIVDTEEEIGSPRLPAAVERHRQELAADMLVIFDGPPHSSGAPTLVFGARGILTVTLTTYGPLVPQHSGHYGNWLPNPALAMARALASMKDEHGRVVIDGWYDGIEISDDARRALARVPDREDSLRAAMGVAAQDSVAATLQEAIQYPSLNIRGLASGWVGDQVRTIIPATATAEIDIRLVRESDPGRLHRLLMAHLEGQGFTVLEREPTEAERRRLPGIITVTSRGAPYHAFRTPLDSEVGRWLSSALRRKNGSDPLLVRTFGGSIPIAPFVTTLGVPAVVVPTVNPDNNQHSPNENLRLGEFLDGIRTIVAVLTEPGP